MSKTIRSMLVLAAVAFLANVAGIAQTAGAGTYKAKCAGCHGATGLADSGLGKVWKVKPVTDPAVEKMSLAAMIDITKNGAGKMPAYKDKLTDPQFKEVVEYFRSLMK
ncbi:MAG: cytochrome c [Terracidiphilus sp.]